MFLETQCRPYRKTKVKTSKDNFKMFCESGLETGLVRLPAAHVLVHSKLVKTSSFVNQDTCNFNGNTKKRRR